MAPAKAAVARHTAPDGAPGEIDECPVMDPRVAQQLQACRQAAKDLGRGVGDLLAPYSDEAKARWLKRAVEASQVVFQPWTMEILFALAVMGETRFGELQKRLGVSSRTLSDKLQALRQAGLVEREVFDEQPVRIEYRLSRDGRAVAALATPLFAQLNGRGAAATTATAATAP